MGRRVSELPRGSLMSGIVLYSRSGCHLCDQAAALLARHGLHYEVVDIDANPDLRARYTECVPVVVIDGKERFRGHVDELLLRRLLAQRDAARDA